MEEYIADVIEKKRAEGYPVTFWQDQSCENVAIPLANVLQHGRTQLEWFFIRIALMVMQCLDREVYHLHDRKTWCRMQTGYELRIVVGGAKEAGRWKLRLKSRFWASTSRWLEPKAPCRETRCSDQESWEDASSSGVESKLTPAQKLELETFQVRKIRELRAYDAHTRVFKAVYSQDFRRIQVGGVCGKRLSGS